MAARNFVRKTIFLPVLFLCIFFIVSVSASLGYEVADTIYSRYSEQSTGSALPHVIGEVTASWYGSAHHEKLTASGQRFDMYKNTLAHRTLPLGTKVRLINLDNGKSAVGVVNDRGPYFKGRDVDVSYAIAKQLGFIKKGIIRLFLEPIWTIGETNQED